MIILVMLGVVLPINSNKSQKIGGKSPLTNKLKLLNKSIPHESQQLPFRIICHRHPLLSAKVNLVPLS